jgi:hypothetical protein
VATADHSDRNPITRDRSPSATTVGAQLGDRLRYDLGVRITVVIGLLGGCGFSPGNGATGDGAPDATSTTPDAGNAADGAADAARPDARDCGPAYAEVAGGQTGSRYRFVDLDAQWLDAEAACEIDGAHLVVLGDAAERDAMLGVVGTVNVWIGVTDRIVELAWLDVTGAPATFLPWATGEPSTNPNHDCLVMRAGQTAENGNFNAKSCDNDLTPPSYLCECDGVAADPTSY